MRKTIILIAACLVCAAAYSSDMGWQKAAKEETWQQKEAFRLRLAELKAANAYEVHEQVYENRVSLIYLQFSLKHPQYIPTPRTRSGRVRDVYRVR